MNRVIRQALVRSVNFDARSVTLVASTDQLCPDNMIILARAWMQDYEAWLKGNPVVLGFHNYHSWAIGHVTEGRIENGQLTETIAFDDVNPEAIVAWSLYSKGHQRAASVGWDTLEADMDLPIGEVLARYMQDLSPETVGQLIDEGKVNTGRKVSVVTRAKKLETSLVPVPMDDKAVVVHATPEGLFSRAATPELLKAAEEFGVQFDKPCVNCRGEHEKSRVDKNVSEGDTPEERVGVIKEHAVTQERLDKDYFPILIKSDGTSYGTTIRDTAGDRIDGVTELNLSVKGGDVVRAELQFESPELDMRAWVRRIGKVLSGKNAATIQTAIIQAKEAVTALEAVLAAAEGGEKDIDTAELQARVERAEADAELRRKLRGIGGGK